MWFAAFGELRAGDGPRSGGEGCLSAFQGGGMLFTRRMRNPILVALDVPTEESALALARQLAPVVAGY